MISKDIPHINNWIIPCFFVLASVVVLLLCMKKKKNGTVTMVRYTQNDETVNAIRRSRTSTNGTNPSAGDRQSQQRLSQNSIPNENRILPAIPKGSDQANGNPPTENGASGTPGVISLDGNQQNPNSSPKKNRRLPALPPTGGGDHIKSVKNRTDKEIDDTYEDLRDDDVANPNPQTEVIGSGDSSLYAKVTDDVEKQIDDTDLYAQVGASESMVKVQKTNSGASSGTANTTENASGISEEDKSMDSPTKVTYASVDKMKKTISIRRDSPPPVAFAPPLPPPIPDRNFDEDDDISSVAADCLLPPTPIVVSETPVTSSTSEEATCNPASSHPNVEESDESGPAYDTLSVRESFAHQRLRQIVEEEQRNRYANTNQTATNEENDGSIQPDVYAQIEDETPEAVYESVSAPGSADGTVGVTARITPARNGTAREDGYVTIETIRAEASATPVTQTTFPSNEDVVVVDIDPHYEDINIR